MGQKCQTTAEAMPLIGSEESASHMDRTQTDVLRPVEQPALSISTRGVSLPTSVGGALSPVRLDVLLTFRAHDQRWAWHIPR